MDRLEGKIAIVTGAASGIGRAAALLFAHEGASVLCVDWEEGAVKETAYEVERHGGIGVYHHGDVSDPRSVEAMVAAAVDEFGAVDVVFNNAGIEGEQAPTAECSIENFDRTIAINLRGVFLGMKYAIPELVKRGGGSIINMASIAALVGFRNIPAYCASKGGVVQLTKTAALEYAPQKIRVNAICPGVIWTPMVDRFTHGDEDARAQMGAIEPVGRMGTAEEVAGLALYLASDESAFCTGSVFTIDGGLTAA